MKKTPKRKVIDTMSARHPWKRRGVSNRRPQSLVVRGIGDTTMSVWEERDRLSIALLRKSDERTIIEWWDDDARDMIESGYLDPRHLHESAYEYARDIAGSLVERKKG